MISRMRPPVARHGAGRPVADGPDHRRSGLCHGPDRRLPQGPGDAETAERDSNVSPNSCTGRQLIEAGILTSPSTGFLTNPDASDQRPESAGLGVAIIGSAYMMMLVLIFTLPVGVAASIYLEEFAPKNRFTDLIEVNISNLAAVPSIVFGILGLAIFINFMPVAAVVLAGRRAGDLADDPAHDHHRHPRLDPGRAAVDPRCGAGVGASKMQTVFHHVLPLAMPGILTGTILGLATALGETAPLLLIGMVAFVTNYPAGPLDGGVLIPRPRCRCRSIPGPRARTRPSSNARVRSSCCWPSSSS
jgi:phosphate transport system permease protein